MTKSLTKKIVTIAIAVCLLLVGVCTFAACGKTKVEGTYYLEEITIQMDQNSDPVTINYDGYLDMRDSYASLTESDKAMFNMVEMFFKQEITIYSDNTARIKVEGDSVEFINGTWAMNDSIVVLSFGEGEQTEKMGFKFENNSLKTLPEDENGMSLLYKKK